MKSENIKYIGAIIILAILLTGFYYKFETESVSTIEPNCSKVAEDKVNKTKFYGFGEEAEKARDFEAFYKQCLYENGL